MTLSRIAMLFGACLLAIGCQHSAVTAAAAVIPVTKVLTFVEENHSLSQMQAGMPYMYAQATKYGYATRWTAIRHPSLPNYLAMAGGSTFGVTDDAGPALHPATTASVFASAIAAGRTAKSYQESMTSNCLTGNSGEYAVKHNAWAYFGAERTSCLKYDVPSGTTTSGALRTDIMQGTLPTVGQVTPNLLHDAHDGSLATADGWLKGWLTLIYASPDWKAGRLAVVVTADEDAGNQGNTVLTAVLHPSQSHRVVTTALNHYSLTQLYTRVGHAPCLRSSCTAPSMVSAFGLTIG
jgi:phosphatidylinositol-3-phosphatase